MKDNSINDGLNPATFRMFIPDRHKHVIQRTLQTSTETGLTQSSVVRNLALNFLKCTVRKELTAASAVVLLLVFLTLMFYKVVYRIATQLRRGTIFNNHVIANFPQNVPVKEFLKSINIWRTLYNCMC